MNTIAIPAIFPSIFGFPKDRVARIIFSTIEKYFNAKPTTSEIKIVKLVLFDRSSVDMFVQVWRSRRGQLA